jgi:hypothetical protein
MRATLPALVVAVLAILAIVPPRAAAAGWRAPAAGPVTRAFDLGPDPFAAGRHRGVDFAAAPGSPVRAACTGRVVVAADIGTSGGVVTIACGPWRVSHLPLARIAVFAGRHVSAGDRIGSAARSRVHAGIHLGVRRAGNPFGYVDPLRFIHPEHAPPPAGPAGRRGRGRRPIAAGRRVRAPSPPRVPAARPVGAPAHLRAPLARHVPALPDAPAPGAARPLAPWPAWVALGALLLAAAGRGSLRLRGAARAARSPVVRTRALAAAGDAQGAGVRRERDDVPP